MIAWTGTAHRFYTKPLGYAGDFYTIELIYQNLPQGEGRLGALVDRCFLEAPASRAVRNRRGLLADEMARLIPGRSPGQPLRVMSLGCGPLREVFDVFHRLDEATRLEVVAVDIDPRALDFAQRQAQAAGVGSRVRFIHADLMAVGDIDLVPQDMIYSVGLVDYFDDPAVVRLLDWIYDRLALGGRALLGNFHPCNPDRALMDYVLEWRLSHRTEADMNHLFQASRFAAPCTRILFEAEGINLFAEGVRS